MCVHAFVFVCVSVVGGGGGGGGVVEKPRSSFFCFQRKLDTGNLLLLELVPWEFHPLFLCGEAFISQGSLSCLNFPASERIRSVKEMCLSRKK